MTNDKTIFTFGRASSHDISEGISHKRRMPFCCVPMKMQVFQVENYAADKGIQIEYDDIRLYIISRHNFRINLRINCT